MSQEAGCTHVVFCAKAGTGHINPILLVASEICRRGKHHVTVFCDEGCAGLVRATGANWQPYRWSDGFWPPFRPLSAAAVEELIASGGSEGESKQYPTVSLWCASELLPNFLQDIKGLLPQPSVIVYDDWLGVATLAAHILGLPDVSLTLYPGPGARPVIDDTAYLAREGRPWVQNLREKVKRLHGPDILACSWDGRFVSSTCNLVSTIPELFAGLREGLQKQRFSSCCFHLCGYTVNSKTCIRAATTNTICLDQVTSAPPLTPDPARGFDIGQLLAAAASGKRILLVSLGTAVTADRQWKKPILGSMTGKHVCHLLWRICAEVMGDDDSLAVVLVIGDQPDAVEGINMPANFVVASSVPQLEVLPHCVAFVSHAGASSMHEALHYGIPLVMLPLAADQHSNATKIQEAGAGIAFLNPSTLTAAPFQEALDSVLTKTDYKDSASALGAKLEALGGARTMADHILLAAGHEG